LCYILERRATAAIEVAFQEGPAMQNWGTGAWLARRTRTRGDRPAYSFGGATYTYAQARDRTARLAWALRDLGVGRGDRVAYLGPNHSALLESMFATWQVAAVFAPLNFRLSPSELSEVIQDADFKVIIFAPSHEEVLRQSGAIAGDRVLIALGESAAGNYEDLIGRSPVIEPDLPVSLEDTALLLYTSGTTGRPKGAMLTHGNLTWNAVNVLLDMDIRADESALVVTPMFHTAALNMVCLPVLLRGGRLIICDTFEPDEILQTVQDERVTLMFGVPATYDRLAECPRWSTADLSSVRTLLCGGAPVPEVTIRRYLDRGLQFLQGYGMTETSPGALLLDEQHMQSKVGSAGVPMFFTDVRVVRPDGSAVDTGEPGEVVVQGPNVFAGYRGQTAATRSALTADGWFHSGDVATVDADGYAYITDRIKDMIISGGENIYPAEIESALQDFPGIRESAVIGIADSTWGEVAMAVVVPATGAVLDPAEVLAFLRDRIAHYKVPKSLVLARELPRTATGKINKVELRACYRAQRGNRTQANGRRCE
jgi:fatty-acyl-CoA synthase